MLVGEEWLNSVGRGMGKFQSVRRAHISLSWAAFRGSTHQKVGIYTGSTETDFEIRLYKEVAHQCKERLCS
jgi:hypothetical protein